MNSIHIKEAIGKRDMKKFISFPDSLYKNNPYRATPLHSFERTILDRAKNPAFEFCEAKYWLAYRNNKIVGRIAAFINWRYVEMRNEDFGRFGWFDFIDDMSVSAILLTTAEHWLKGKGMKAIHGPLGFSDMDMEGMLVEGFEEEGTQATLYNHPYYPIHMEHYGFIKDIDWIQKKITVPNEVPKKLKQFAEVVEKRYNLRTLKTKKAKELIPYAKSMFYTLNKSFDHLYGFTSLTDKQIDYYIKQYFSLIRPEFVRFVISPEDEVVGFGISMPSLTKALIQAKGKLLPFGFIPILKAIHKKNEIMDMYLNGVHPDYQGKGAHVLYYAELTQVYIDNGIKVAISNPQMETNTKALQLWKHFEAETHIRRRCYIKHFS